jgi:hypothetical protein
MQDLGKLHSAFEGEVPLDDHLLKEICLVHASILFLKRPFPDDGDSSLQKMTENSMSAKGGKKELCYQR